MIVRFPLTFTASMVTILCMNPNEAELLSTELTQHMNYLATLDLHPIRNASDIEMHRREALACIEQLHAHLLLSDAFGGVA